MCLRRKINLDDHCNKPLLFSNGSDLYVGTIYTENHVDYAFLYQCPPPKNSLGPIKVKDSALCYIPFEDLKLNPKKQRVTPKYPYFGTISIGRNDYQYSKLRDVLDSGLGNKK